MYKSMITLLAAAPMLTACNHDKADENKGKPVQTTDENQTNTENEQQKQPSQTETQANPKHEKWSSLPEYDKIIGKSATKTIPSIRKRITMINESSLLS